LLAIRAARIGRLGTIPLRPCRTSVLIAKSESIRTRSRSEYTDFRSLKTCLWCRSHGLGGGEVRHRVTSKRDDLSPVWLAPRDGLRYEAGMMQTTKSGKGAFPTTDWGLFVDIRGGSPPAKQAALDILARRYWKPVFKFLQFSGKDEEAAKDLTQAFFAEWIENNAFAKADAQKGKFRSFMLTSLKRFAANKHRDGQAQKRSPAAGLVSLDELMDDDESSYEPAHDETPDKAFDRTWAAEVVGRVLKHLEVECSQKDQKAHFDIFSRRLIQPILHGVEAPSMAELGKAHGLSEKQAGNLLETAKRTYRRLLEEEIRLYAATDSEVSDEVREIFAILNQ